MAFVDRLRLNWKFSVVIIKATSAWIQQSYFPQILSRTSWLWFARAIKVIPSLSLSCRRRRSFCAHFTGHIGKEYSRFQCEQWTDTNSRVSRHGSYWKKTAIIFYSSMYLDEIFHNESLNQRIRWNLTSFKLTLMCSHANIMVLLGF